MTGPHDQSAYQVRFGWGGTALASLAAAPTVVIVDVLTFSTAVDAAVAAGASALPFRYSDASAPEYAAARGAVLAVARSAVSPAQPYSLSPGSLRMLTPGSRVVLPSPNGATLSLAAAETGSVVIAGCLRNRAAVAAWAAGGGEVAVIAAGERWADGSLRPAVEDLIGAGAIIDALPASLCRSPEADAAAAGFRAAAGDLTDRLLACASGRELVEGGWTEDVLTAAGLDESRQVPRLDDGAYRAG